VTDLSVVVLPDLDPPARFLAAVRDAEAAGVRAVWTYDHLSWRDLRDGPWYGAVPLLAAAATATTRVRLGTGVASPNFRHPVPFGKEVMTLDALSAGRFDLGLGAGGAGSDATVLGTPARPPRERAERFEEFVGLLDLLLRSPATSYDGHHFSATDARMIPGSVQRPRVPFTVAAAGPRALRIAARYGDAWVTYGPARGADSPAEFYAALEAQSARLDAALAVEERSVRRLVQLGLDDEWVLADYRGFLDRVRGLGFDEVVLHWPRPDGRGVPADRLAEVLALTGL